MSKNIVNEPTVFKEIDNQGLSGVGSTLEQASPLELGNLDIADVNISNPTGTIQTHDSNAITYGASTDIEYTNRVFLHSVVSAGGQSIPTSTYTAVDFDGSIISTETGDYTFDGTRFTNSSTATKYVIASVYLFYSGGSTVGKRQAIIVKNKAAADVLPSDKFSYWSTYKTDGTFGKSDTIQLSAVLKLEPNDFFEVATYQDSGSSLNVSTGGTFHNHQYSRIIVAEV